MKYLVVAQVFTTIAFGVSIALWTYLPVSIPLSMEGAPRYLIHPLFTTQFFLMLSTEIIWTVLFLFSFYQSQLMKTLTEIVKHDWFGFLLAIFAVIGSVSGCMFYSENVYLGVADLIGTPAVPPPNPITTINMVSLLLYELLWIVNSLIGYSRVD